MIWRKTEASFRCMFSSACILQQVAAGVCVWADLALGWKSAGLQNREQGQGWLQHPPHRCIPSSMKASLAGGAHHVREQLRSSWSSTNLRFSPSKFLFVLLSLSRKTCLLCRNQDTPCQVWFVSLFSFFFYHCLMWSYLQAQFLIMEKPHLVLIWDKYKIWVCVWSKLWPSDSFLELGVYSQTQA